MIISKIYAIVIVDNSFRVEEKMGFQILLVDNQEDQNPLRVLPYNQLGGNISVNFVFDSKREVPTLPVISDCGEFSSDDRTFEQLKVIVGDEIPSQKAELSATYNYSKMLNDYFNRYFGVDCGFKSGIYGMKANELAPFFRTTIAEIGEQPPSASFYDVTQGNIKALFSIILGWCVQQPNGVFVTH